MAKRTTVYLPDDLAEKAERYHLKYTDIFRRAVQAEVNRLEAAYELGKQAAIQKATGETPPDSTLPAFNPSDFFELRDDELSQVRRGYTDTAGTISALRYRGK